jgi:hypothetical protein
MRGVLCFSGVFMHDGQKMNREAGSATNKVKQILVSCWAVASFAWYFKRFLPALTPVFQRLLHRPWH